MITSVIVVNAYDGVYYRFTSRSTNSKHLEGKTMKLDQLKGDARELATKFPTVVDVAGWVLGAAIVVTPIAAFAKAVVYPMDPIIVPLHLPISPTTVSTMKVVDEKELDCLANNIYYESRNQSDLGMLAVGLVTLTRVESHRWSDTVCGVVYENKQFTWTWDGKQSKAAWARAHADRLKYLQSLNLASRILYGDFDNMREMFNANHYHTTKVRPSWTAKMERLAVIDDHVFYVDP